MNKDQRLLEEAYKLVLEGNDQEFLLSKTEKFIFEEFCQEVQQIVDYYKEMLISTIRATPRGYIDYSKDKNRTAIANFRVKIFNAAGNIIKKYFSTNHPTHYTFQAFFTVCTQPFKDFDLSADENDDLFLSLVVANSEGIFDTKSPKFDSDRTKAKLFNILKDWLEQRLDERYGGFGSDYREQREKEVRDLRIQKRVDKELDPEFNVDLEDF
jgi:hypothetical protein